MPKIRLKGIACLQFWQSVCGEDQREVLTQRLEGALCAYFTKIERYAIVLILNHVICSNNRRSHVSIEEFDHFVRKFLPFEECMKVAVEALIDPQAKDFFVWFHGYAKPGFSSLSLTPTTATPSLTSSPSTAAAAATTPLPGDATSQPAFYVRLSTNTQLFHDIIPARCLVEHSVCGSDRAKLSVQHISRTKHNGKYVFTTCHPTIIYETFYHYIATKKAQNYVALPRAISLSVHNLQELSCSPHNSQCFNCMRVGAQSAVCVNFGTFVCASCAGLQRQMGHVVKSLASPFTSAEIEAIVAAGNEVCAKLYLHGCDRTDLNVNSVEAMRTFLHQVYVDKLWFANRSRAVLETEMSEDTAIVSEVRDAKADQIEQSKLQVQNDSRLAALRGECLLRLAVLK